MIRRLFAALLITLMAAAPAMAAEPFTAAQRLAIDAAVKNFIMDNPQIMISSVEAYYNKQAQSKKAQEGPLTSVPADLVGGDNTPAVGPKNAKVTVVEFFDYNCGYCKQVANDVDRLISEDKTVRVAFKELPILSDTSEVAARYALAVNKQGKYLPYHMALLQHQGPITEAYLTETAKSQGVDIDKLKKDVNSQDIRDALAKNIDLARSLGVRGTPFFVIGKQKVPGAIGYSRIKEIIAEESGNSAPAAKAAPAAAAEPAVEPVVAPTPAPAAAAPDVKSEADEPVAKPIDTSSTAPDAAPDESNLDPEAQAEIAKAKREARAMVDQIKAEADRMQAQAVQAQKDAASFQDAAQTKANAEKMVAKAKANADAALGEK